MVASAHTHGAADDIGLAVMGVRGLHDLGNIIEDDEETEEEKREREARIAGCCRWYCCRACDWDGR